MGKGGGGASYVMMLLCCSGRVVVVLRRRYVEYRGRYFHCIFVGLFFFFCKNCTLTKCTCTIHHVVSSVCVLVYLHMCVHACMCVCVCVYVCSSMCVCVCVEECNNFYSYTMLASHLLAGIQCDSLQMCATQK